MIPLTNLLNWSLQAAILTAGGSALAVLFRRAEPRLRLRYWQMLLIVFLLLPLLQSWKQTQPLAGSVTARTGAFHVADASQSAGWVLSWPTACAAILALGIAMRLTLLVIGMLRLRQYRRRAASPIHGFSDLALIAPAATLLVSREVSSPVTFGWREPVVLVPSEFPGLSEATQRSIVCHELLHVRRRDWACTIAEELVRAALWFHPGIWWILAQIQLTREQVVDADAVKILGDPQAYLDALLAVASRNLRPDLAPAPSFLMQHHLRRRVEALVEGARMTFARWVLSLATAALVLPLVMGFAILRFPLHAQEPMDDPGIEVRVVGNGRLVERTGIRYPASARDARTSGTVWITAPIDGSGRITGALNAAGPAFLMNAAMISVTNWRFESATGRPEIVRIAVRFTTEDPQAATAQPVAGLAALRSPQEVPRVTTPTPPPTAVRVKRRTQIRQGIPQSPADVRQAGPDLQLTADPLQETTRRLTAGPPDVIRVGGDVIAANLITKVNPDYPPIAKQARIQGKVRLNTVIGPDGAVQNLQVLSGHPMLVQSALDAVRHWIYKPTLLNGNPVTVNTIVDVNYTLTE